MPFAPAPPPCPLTRRAFTAGLGAAGAVTLLASPGRTQPAEAEVTPDGTRILRARPGEALSGPLLRVRRDEELKVRLVNDLPHPLALHWHGVRLPNAMDAVPRLTQPPIAPGASFDYRFKPPDAGTFWYRAWSLAASERGLSGALIVDEPEPPAVDQDLMLVFDSRQAVPAAGGPSTEQLTVNGRPTFDIPVRPGERIRLRLLNASGTRLLAVRIDQHRATVMAIDGQPAEPFTARDARVVLGPGNRTDLFVDMSLAAGAATSIVAETATASATVARLVYQDAAVARPQPLPEIKSLPANPLPARMDFARALRLDLPLDPAALRPSARQPARGAPESTRARVWSSGDGAGAEPFGPALFSVKRGRAVMLGFSNGLRLPHAVHIHGHAVRLLDNLDDGWKPYWLDTIAVMPEQTARVAFVGDNPGKWLIECQRLEQPEKPLAAWFEVT
ncbi:MAG TPA: multicopper oxidase family protein [Xanthobacteraceae bacterium]